MVVNVRKRSGEVVLFEKDKISNAVLRAIRSVEKLDNDEIVAVEVTETVLKVIDKKFDEDHVPTVEGIQDIVEEVLIKNDYVAIAKSYILYRQKRKEIREAAREGVVEKGFTGRLNVKKRDGSIEHFDLDKIKRKIARASQGFENVIKTELIIEELMKNIYEGVTSDDLDRALILSSSSFIEKDPAYSYVSARLFLEKIYREVFNKKSNSDTFDDNYKLSFPKAIKKGVEEGPLDPQLLNYDLDYLASHIDSNRDLLFQYMGIQTLYERYFVRINKKVLETPQFFLMRVAMGLAVNEVDKNEKAVKFYDLLSTLRFMSSTPTLFHSGTKRPQLSSCYLTTVEDDLSHIFKTYSDNSQLSKWSGGIGNDWTNVRSTGAIVKGPGIESQGTIPFLKIANDVTSAINRSGRRRGATCAYLETWHLDVEDFLDLRKNTGDDRRRTHDMNTANWIPDLFMKRVIQNKDWTLFSPHDVPDLHNLYGSAFEKRYEMYEQMAKNGEIKQHKVIPAVKLWRKMISMLFETGHPWITFKDPCNVRSPQDHVGVIHSSNLCTEITLNTSEDEVAVCNLGSVNLSAHVDYSGKIDYDKLKETVSIAINMLDNVIDINFYPIPEAKNSNMRHRPIGLGIMGLQDLFFKMDLPFDSSKALDVSDEIMEAISYFAISASSDLAGKKGAYSSFHGSKWDRGIFPIDSFDLLEQERGEKIPVSRKIRLDWENLKRKVKQQGMRNSNVLAIAPTATISTISGCFPCIEPIYKNIYVKSNMSGEFTIINHYLVEDLKKFGQWNDLMIEKLKYYDGDLSRIEGVPDHLALKYKESFQIDPVVSVMHTALRSKWIDQSQSHNMFIRGTSGKSISDAYIYAWRCGLKTTYYLRSLAASQIEKSTLDASKYGYTQKREYKNDDVQKEENVKPVAAMTPSVMTSDGVKLCRIEDPDCEACQ